VKRKVIDKMETENFSLKWNDFEENISTGLQDLRKSNNFFDVTLLSETGQVGAHKLILSACSSFFRNILVSNPHQHPLIYLKGVSKEEITNLLNFMYCGEVNVAQTELSSFLAAAEDLKVKGLTNCGTGENNSKRTKVSDVPESKTNTKTLNKLSRSNSVKIHEDIPMVDLVQVKSEPLLSGDNTSGKSLVAPDYEVDSGDFQYDDYQVQETGFEDEFTNNIAASKVSASPQFYPFPQDSFSIHSGQVHNTSNHLDQGSLRKRRQQILQFINQNKGKMADSYLCLLCNKSVTDNSNMNKHLEFKHNDELKEFLANLS